MKLFIRGGRLIDPAQGIDAPGSLWIEEGRIVALLSVDETAPGSPDLIVDATGLVVAPGFIDLHVHLREPGQTHKEDIESGTRAAVAGGYTSVLCMPNTTPVNDSVEVTRLILARVKETGHCRVYPVGALTVGLQGREVAPLAALKEAGCVAFTDDGRPVNDARVMRQSMELARDLNLCVMEHCEELELSAGGVLHDGEVAKKLNVRGIPRSAETVDLARALLLAAETGCRLHVSHVSCAETADLLAAYKPKLPGLTAEVTPHNLFLTDEAVLEFGADAKMYPPLREERDCERLREALRSGLIDALATDHAPHAEAEKKAGLEKAPKGVVGLETALALAPLLVEEGTFSLSQLVDRMSTTPARIAGIPGGTLKPGTSADIVLFDPDEPRTLKRSELVSKSKNTPFDGYAARGRVIRTFVAGRQVFPEMKA